MDKAITRNCIALIIAFICACALCVTLCACGQSGNKADFAGEWEAASLDDPSMGTIDMSTLKAFDLSLTLSLNEDGSGSIDRFGSDTDLTWEASAENQISITIEGEGTYPFELEDESLTGDMSGTKITFVRASSQ